MFQYGWIIFITTLILLLKKVMVMGKMSKNGDFQCKMSKKLWFSRPNVPKMLNFKEYFSLRRIFIADIFSRQRILHLLTSIVRIIFIAIVHDILWFTKKLYFCLLICFMYFFRPSWFGIFSLKGGKNFISTKFYKICQKQIIAKKVQCVYYGKIRHHSI